jgi:hypothetical protein
MLKELVCRITRTKEATDEVEKMGRKKMNEIEGMHLH